MQFRSFMNTTMIKEWDQKDKFALSLDIIMSIIFCLFHIFLDILDKTNISYKCYYKWLIYKYTERKWII